MPLRIKLILCLLGVTVAVFGLTVTTANAQLAPIEPSGNTEVAEVDADLLEDSETIEEIVVLGQKPGSRRRVDAVYEDPMRARLLKDLEELRANEEEYKWLAEEPKKNTSNVQWGYDPRDDYLTRDEIDLLEHPTENNKPATLFKIGF